MMKRIEWIDYGKVFAIYLVILAHTNLYEPLEAGIYTFHMPFFFFLSGFLFSFERNPSYKQFVKKRFKQLIIPYIWINIIAYVFWFFIASRVGADADIPVAWYSPIINALLANGKGMVHDVPLWFFVCLFVIENLFFIFKKIRVGWSILLIVIILGFLNYTFNSIYLPFSINTALVGIVFYTFGFIYNSKNIYERTTSWIWFIVSFLSIILITYYNGKIAMHINYYGNYWLFILGGIAGIIMLCNLCVCIERIVGNNKWISYIASNTLLICGFHLLIFSFIKGIMVYVLHIPITVLDKTIGANILFSFISLLLCLPLIYVVNRYFPFIIGKKRVISPLSYQNPPHKLQ